MKQTPSSQRRLTLRDAMILMAAFGTGLLITREYSLVLPRIYPMWGQGDWKLRFLAWSPMLLIAHLGLLVLRILPPRPSRRQLARQPGFVAGAAVATMVLLQTADATYKWAAVPVLYRGSAPSLVWFHTYVQMLSPPTIVVAWVILVLQRPRSGRQDWIELVGRLFGLAWIVGWVSFLVMLTFF